MSEYRLLLGDCLEQMKTLEANSIDAIVCDPPYMINFMNKAFDRAKDNPAANVEVWAEMLRVAKPGAHLLAFGGDRTHHRMMCAIEDAGWELRTALYWCFGSGFPKSHDVSKAIDRMAGAEREVIGSKVGLPGYRNGETGPQVNAYGNGLSNGSAKSDITAPATDAAKQWLGWGSALKPAVEIIVMARKPLSEPTIAANCLRWGTGALAIDKCRIGTDDNLNGGAYAQNGTHRDDGWGMQRGGAGDFTQPTGRWPANLLLDDQAAALLDEMSGLRKSGGGNKSRRGNTAHTAVYGNYGPPPPDIREVDVGHASRFFARFAPDADDEPLRMAYIAKASKRDRDEGLEGMPEGKAGALNMRTDAHSERNGMSTAPRKNGHPCVKPTALMRWLVRLVTPPGGTVLDPFMGSGSTGKACMLEGFAFVGVELDEEYLAIAAARIEHALAGALRARRLQDAAVQPSLFAEGIL